MCFPVGFGPLYSIPEQYDVAFFVLSTIISGRFARGGCLVAVYVVELYCLRFSIEVCHDVVGFTVNQ